MKNEFAKTLFLAGEKVQYDAQCKKVLSHKVILAWILKYTVKEFRESALESIAACIRENAEISAVHVNSGRRVGERISGSFIRDTRWTWKGAEPDVQSLRIRL